MRTGFTGDPVRMQNIVKTICLEFWAMVMDIGIREAECGDAEVIRLIIVSALRESNASDYSPEIITRLEKNFAPPAIEAFLENRRVYVALVSGTVVGTASLEAGYVRTVFIAPDMQGCGVGKRLLQEIENAARSAGLSVLLVQSSVTAEPFYAKLGFTAVGDRYHGDERTILMQMSLSG